ncbi:MAG: hypothetical protein ACXWYM_00370 [Candidatus Binatia bacterium]
MTTICAKASPDGTSIAFGSDRNFRIGELHQTLPEPKWFTSPTICFGIAGVHKFFPALVEHAGELADAAREMGDKPLALSRVLTKACEAADIKKDEENLYNATGIIIAPRIGAWLFCNALHTIRIRAGQFFAVGSGADFAFGAAHATPEHMPDYEHVIAALDAACARDRSSVRPLDIFYIASDGEIRHHERA